MSASWMVNVGGRAYGPYTDAQMATFAAEGRIAPQSLVARAGENGFRIAGDDAELAALFIDKAAANDPPSNKKTRNENRIAGAFGRNAPENVQPREPAQVVIIADMKSRSIQGIEEEIYKLGQVFQLMPQIWLLRTDQTVNTVRNVLVQQLGKLDRLFVIDTANNKAAWFNFAPEAEARIRRIWARAQDVPPKLQAMG